MNIIKLAKDVWREDVSTMDLQNLERFAYLVRAEAHKEFMAVCEAEYKKYDEMVVEDDMGHDECCALIHLMRKLEKLK